jgi:PAS domain S-box-containing protein
VHSAGEGALIALFVLVAWLVRRWHRLSSAVASLGLMSVCALLVHFWDGAIEAHFLFFVMVAVIALYEDWMPFLLALAFVVGEHAVIGVIAPGAVYNHPDATAHPWQWALIHGGFVAAAAAASLTAWRFNEEVRADTRRAAADAEASRARLSDLVRGLDAIVWEADPDTFRFTFVNERAEELLGHPIDRWGEPGFWASILHPDDRQMAVDFCTQATAAGRDHDFEYRAVAADGRTVWLRDLVRVETDETDTPRQLRGLMVDITRQKEAEQELRRGQSIIRAVLDATPDAIQLADLEGNVLLANRAAREDVADLLPPDVPRPDRPGSVYERGEMVADYTSDPAGFRAALRALAVDPAREAHDEWELAATGRSFVRYSAPVRIGSDAGSIFGRILVRREVTDERRLVRAKDEFTQLASHELRTPLTSIMGYLEIVLAGDAGDLFPEQRRFLEVAERNAGRLLRLVGDLLVIARADAGRLGLEMAALDLGELAAECAQGARPAAGEQGIALELAVEPLALSGDRGRLAEVIDNLVSNALKFTPPGGWVRVSARRENGRAVLEVADSGMGIAAADQEHLFERFYRTEAALRAAIPGTGLGLSISKMIAEAHGGTIGVSSEEGRGATFRMTLPLPAGPGGVGTRVDAGGLARAGARPG